MRVTLGSVAAAVLAIAACAGCSQATSTAEASAESQAAVVTAVGCPMTPQPGCVTIAANGKTYDVSQAGIDLSRGVGVSLKGQASGATTACGATLTDVKVDYLGLQCGVPAAPAAPAG